MTLRSDNADLRLTRKGRRTGVSEERWSRLLEVERNLDNATGTLKEIQLSPNVCSTFYCLWLLAFTLVHDKEWACYGVNVSMDGVKKRLVPIVHLA